MYPILIPLLSFAAVASLVLAVAMVRSARRSTLKSRLDLAQDIVAVQMSADSTMSRALGRLGEITAAKEPSPNLRAQLAQAGYHARSAATIYMGTKVVLLLAGLVAFSAIILPVERIQFWTRVILVAWASVSLFMIPNFVVRRRRQVRQQQIRNSLPDMLDLLEICVSAGMGLDLAWNSVGEEIREVCPALADEMALANFEIHLNAPRAAAMRHMAERTAAEEIASLAAVLVQSDRFGTSVGDALRVYASTMREARSRRAEEAAEKMVIKLLFPMILLIFPAILIVICGPAGLRWVRLISGD